MMIARRESGVTVPSKLAQKKSLPRRAKAGGSEKSLASGSRTCSRNGTRVKSRRFRNAAFSANSRTASWRAWRCPSSRRGWSSMYRSRRDPKEL